MNYWLIKSEPEAYSLDDFRREGVGRWDGVRNYLARNYLRTMQLGDYCIFYRSVSKPAAIALARVVRKAYPDPTAPEKERERWSCIEVAFEEAFSHEVTLNELKMNDLLKDMVLFKMSRLSVQPVEPLEFEEICRLGRQKF
jgi:predicted RNA-binding protein with PUA-like domain